MWLVIAETFERESWPIKIHTVDSYQFISDTLAENIGAVTCKKSKNENKKRKRKQKKIKNDKKLKKLTKAKKNKKTKRKKNKDEKGKMKRENENMKMEGKLNGMRGCNH